MNQKYHTSLELSIKLEEAGVHQNSEFYWFHSILHPPQICTMEAIQTAVRNEKLKEKNYQYFSAFISDELGEILPWDLTISRNIDKQWHVHFMGNGLSEDYQHSVMSENNEAEARGKLLLHLIEHNLISFEAKASESDGV